MRGFIAILSGSSANNSPVTSPTTESAPTSSSSAPPTPTRTSTASSSSSSSTASSLSPPPTATTKRSSHQRSSSMFSLTGLMADTVHHEVKLVRYTEHVAQYHSDSGSDDDDYDVDDTKFEKQVQRFFERDWDGQDWDADAEVWEEPDWSQRVREDRRLTNARKEARI